MGRAVARMTRRQLALSEVPQRLKRKAELRRGQTARAQNFSNWAFRECGGDGIGFAAGTYPPRN